MKKQIIILSMAAFFAAAGMAGAQNIGNRETKMTHMKKTTTVDEKQNNTQGHTSHMMMQDTTDNMQMKMMQDGKNMSPGQMMQKHMAMMQQMMDMHKKMMQDTVMKKKMMAMMAQKGSMQHEMMQKHQTMMQECMQMQKNMMQKEDLSGTGDDTGRMDPMKSKQVAPRPEMKKMDGKGSAEISGGATSVLLVSNIIINTLK